MVHVSGDEWTGTYSNSGTTFTIRVRCGTLHSGCQDCRIESSTGEAAYAFPLSLISSTHTYAFASTAGFPNNFNVTDLSFTLGGVPVPLTVRQSAVVTGSQAHSLTATFPVATLAGSEVVGFVFQYGSLVSGGIGNPVVAGSGWALDHSANHGQGAILHYTGSGSIAGYTQSLDGAWDLQALLLAEIEHPPTSSGGVWVLNDASGGALSLTLTGTTTKPASTIGLWAACQGQTQGGAGSDWSMDFSTGTSLKHGINHLNDPGSGNTERLAYAMGWNTNSSSMAGSGTFNATRSVVWQGYGWFQQP